MILLRLLMRLNARLARHRGERGQATAEYALVLLGAAAVAMLLVSWVTKTNRISNLLDAVFRHITGLVS
jgi:Flp pilus assembly pilin Flp